MYADPEIRRAYNREYMRRRRLERKLADQCADCGRQLADDESGRCRACLARYPERDWTPADNERKRRERIAREALGLCSWCMARATCGKLCYGHRRKATKAMRRHRQKDRAAPVASTPRTRLLRALSRLDWPTSGELFAVMGVPEGGHDLERMAAAQMLSRMVRGGFAEARGPHGAKQYAITAMGRAVLAPAGAQATATRRKAA